MATTGNSVRTGFACGNHRLQQWLAVALLLLATAADAATAPKPEPPLPKVAELNERVAAAERELHDFKVSQYPGVTALKDQVEAMKRELYDLSDPLAEENAKKLKKEMLAIERSVQQFLKTARATAPRSEPPLSPVAGGTTPPGRGATTPAVTGLPAQKPAASATAPSAAPVPQVPATAPAPAPASGTPASREGTACGMTWAAAKRDEDGGNRASAYAHYRELAGMQCSDAGLVDEARAFVAEYEAKAAAARAAAAPPPPLPQPKRPVTGPPVPRPAATAGVATPFTLDVWQSAWGEFRDRDLDQLTTYLRRNGITAVNLNPGNAMSAAMVHDANPMLRRVVDRLRSEGIDHINYLYAELNYDIGNYARFLRRHPELGITTIVDDSEFTDASQPQFAANLAAVKAEHLTYSAFITLESVGNSGVSNDVRRWGIEHIDEPILMSYFSCNVDEQKALLRDYLDYAETLGRQGFVKVAVLLGSKSVGRERSCEQELDEGALQAFLRDLDDWCRGYGSYGGLVLETNQRLPRNVRR